MARTLTDDDVDAIAQRIVQIIAARLGPSDLKPNNPPAPPAPAPANQRLAYRIDELMAELGVGRTTLWRWEVFGLLKPVPHLRHKLYSRESVERFLKGQTGSWKDSPEKRRRPRAAEIAATENS